MTGKQKSGAPFNPTSALTDADYGRGREVPDLQQR